LRQTADFYLGESLYQHALALADENNRRSREFQSLSRLQVSWKYVETILQSGANAPQIK
jgi:hypothetical protein